MFDTNVILAGLADAFNLVNILFVLAGVILGQFVGAIPGLATPMAIAIAVPFTYVLHPLTAVAFLMGVAKGGTVGSAVPAILINTPGSPDAAATTLDGHPLAKQGKAKKALKMALFSSITGDTMSDIVLITVAAPLAVVALMMGPVEIVCLVIFAFAVIAGLVGDSIGKSMIAVGFGLLCATVGLDPENGTPRFTFGNFELDDGLPLSSVAIGVLAVSEIFRQIARRAGSSSEKEVVLPFSTAPEDNRVTFKEYWSCRGTLLRAGVIGTIVGAIPGVASAVASFLSYGYTRNSAKNPEDFGKGELRGIAAAEGANSAVQGANMIPLLTLGIPGNVTAALIVGALIIQGIQPGPFLFRDQGQLIYGLFGAMMIANVINLCVGLVGLRLWSQLVRAPASVIFPVSLLLCVTGVYLTTGRMFGVGIMIAFAALGYVMQTLGISIVAFIIAFFLGPQLELSLAQALIVLDGDLTAVVNHPVALALLALTVFMIYWLGLRPSRRHRRAGANDVSSSPNKLDKQVAR